MRTYMFEDMVQRGLWHVVKDRNCSLTRIVFTGTYAECKAYMREHVMGSETHPFCLPDTRALGRTGYVKF